MINYYISSNDVIIHFYGIWNMEYGTGDSPGMNAAIRAVVHTAAQSEIQCFGIRFVYKGLIEGDVLEL